MSQQLSAARQMNARCMAAAELSEKVEDAHPISLPLSLGHELVLRRVAAGHTEGSRALAQRMEEVKEEITILSKQLVMVRRTRTSI